MHYITLTSETIFSIFILFTETETMKLLDWMHRKFRNGEPLKEISTGNPCICLMGQPSLDDFEYYPKSNYYAKPSNKSRENQLRKSFACLEGVRADDDHTEDESSAALSELFHGFLAIGTLGMDPVTSDPGTPTFSTSVEYIMEKETEATENELQFINYELEKVLTGEGKEDDSSARNSYVSNGRSSHGSTITLSGKPLEAADSENGSVACPLQGYLFGSAVGLPETTTGKKEHRTSLGELFQKTKLADENTGNKCNKVEKQKEKETEKSAVHLMKKILKGRKASGGTGSIDTASADKKLNKILHMFHRKVHPESTTKSQNRSKNMMNAPSVNEGVYKKRNQMISGGDITIIPERDISKKIANYTKSNMPQATCGANDSNENRECWIKSDADYLVLEL